MFPRSIRWRLNLWLGVLLIGVLSGFGVTVYHLQRVNQRNQLLAQIDEELERRTTALSIAVRGGSPPFGGRLGHSSLSWWPGAPPPSRGRPEGPPLDGGPGGPRGPDGPGGPEGRSGPREFRLSEEAASLFDETRTEPYYFAVWSRSGTLIKRSTNAPSDVPWPERLARDTRTHTRMRSAYREAYHFTELGDCVLAGRSLAAGLHADSAFAWVLLAAGGIVLAFGLGSGWWLTTRAIRPVEIISAAASRISAGNLSERIVGADPDNELGRLAGVLNSTFARLEAGFAQQKQFTADASHELRTPLTVIISEAQTALARDRSAGEYRETVVACLEAAQQMRGLAQSLLELARFDAGQENIERKPFDLAEQSRAALELLRPLARKRELRITCDLARTEAVGDASRIRQVITNLLTNAIQYNRERGEIEIATRAGAGEGWAILSVADTGRGIAPEDLPHIFERFYRADKSRAHGQSGLGLAICRAIVDAHGGIIEVSSRPAGGTIFTVKLPAASQFLGRPEGLA